MFVHEQEAITFPEQDLDPVTSSSTKKEQCVFIMWIQLKLIPDNRSQPVNSTAEIRITDEQIDLFKASGIIEYRPAPLPGFAAFQTACPRRYPWKYQHGYRSATAVGQSWLVVFQVVSLLYDQPLIFQQILVFPVSVRDRLP